MGPVAWTWGARGGRCRTIPVGRLHRGLRKALSYSLKAAVSRDRGGGFRVKNDRFWHALHQKELAIQRYQRFAAEQNDPAGKSEIGPEGQGGAA